MGPQKLVAEIQNLNTAMQTYLAKEVKPLMQGLKALEERESKEIGEKLGYLTDELTRNQDANAEGDVTSAAQVPPGPL